MVFRNILYVIEDGLEGMKGLEQVVMLARRTGASVTVADVIESLPKAARMLVTSVPAGELANHVIRERQGQLEALVALIGNGEARPGARALFGSPARQISREVLAGGYDLVIKTPGKRRTDNNLVRNCTCPVWIPAPDDCASAERLFAAFQARFPGLNGPVTGTAVNAGSAGAWSPAG